MWRECSRVLQGTPSAPYPGCFIMKRLFHDETWRGDTTFPRDHPSGGLGWCESAWATASRLGLLRVDLGCFESTWVSESRFGLLTVGSGY